MNVEDVVARCRANCCHYLSTIHFSIREILLKLWPSKLGYLSFEDNLGSIPGRELFLGKITSSTHKYGRFYLSITVQYC